MKNIFISYAREDSKKANMVYQKLKENPDCQPWIDKEDLLPGMQWNTEIRKAIREADYFLALLSKNSLRKNSFVQEEMKVALDIFDKFPENRIYFIPARLDKSTISSKRLRKIQYVNLFPEMNDGFEKIMKVIQHDRRKGFKQRNPADSGYHYRCGILDLDNGLVNIAEITKRLNSIQDFIQFTNPTVRLPAYDAVEEMPGPENINIGRLPKALYNQREYLNVDLVGCLTKYLLAIPEDDDTVLINYFSSPSLSDEHFMFISLYSLYEYCKAAKCTFEKGVVYILASQLVVFFSTARYHSETRGCLMDFCRKRTDIVQGLIAKKLCPSCEKEIINPDFRNAIKSILKDDFKV